MLEVFGVLGDQGVSELAQSHGQLRSDLRPNKVLYGLLGGLIGVVCDLVLDIAGSASAPCSLRWYMGWSLGTYNVLIFPGVVGDLRDADGAGDILTVLGLTY